MNVEEKSGFIIMHPEQTWPQRLLI